MKIRSVNLVNAEPGSTQRSLVSGGPLTSSQNQRAVYGGSHRAIRQPEVARLQKSMDGLMRLRTFTMQVEALQRYRGKGQQKVTVEHVHVHAGGQAIVGAVHPPEPNTKFEGQADGGRAECT